MSIQRNQRISGKTTRVGSSPTGQAVLHLFVSARYRDHIPRDREAMPLFVLHLHKVVAHPALCRDNRYLQIGRHQAYAVGSCVESPTREVDVRTDRIRYSVLAREGSQGTSIDRPRHRKN
jgi:hypothetical protein